MAEPNETNAGHPAVCPEPPAVQVALPEPKLKEKKEKKRKKEKKSVLQHQEAQPEPQLEPCGTEHSQPQLCCAKKKKKKGEEPDEANVEHRPPEPIAVQVQGALPELIPKEPCIAAEHPVPVSEPTPPKDSPKKWKRKKEKKNVLEPQEAQPEPKEPSNASHSQPQLSSAKEKKKKKGAEPNEANAGHPAVYPEPPAVQVALPGPPGALPEPKPKEPCSAEQHPEPDPTPRIDTPEKMKLKKEKKSILEPQETQPEPKEPGNAGHSQPQLSSAKEKKKEKGAEPNEANAGHPAVCPEPPAVQVALPEPELKEKKEKKRKKEKKSVLQHQEAQPEPQLEPCGTEHSQPQLCSAKKKKKKGEEPDEANVEHRPPEPIAVQVQGALPELIPKEPCIAAEHPVPVSEPTPPKDSPKKWKRKKEKKNVLEPQEAQPEPKEPSNADHSQPQLSSTKEKKKKKMAKPNETNAGHPAVCPEPPAVQVALPEPKLKEPSSAEQPVPEPTSPKDSPKKWKRKKEKKSVLEPKPNEATAELPLVCPTIPVCPKPASLIDQSQTILVVDTDKKMNNKKNRKRKRSSMPDGTEPNEHNTKPPETPLLASNCHIDQSTPLDPRPAIPTILEQKTPTKKRAKKKNVLLSEGGKSSEHNGKATETPVQKSVNPIKAPSIDPTFPTDQPVPIDPATPKDPEGNMSNKKKRKRNAETPVRKIQPPRVPKSQPPRVAKAESVMTCQACQQPGHNLEKCQRLKCLSKDEEVCFFCGEIGHSLGSCSLSRAGGGRFAKCLLCHMHGHFSYNCTRYGPQLIQSQQ